MAEAERPHRSSSLNSSNNNTTTDLFICFTSRLSSSSSMRLSSKSILSPARSASLTSSISRRLRSSGSLKRGVLASPMFGASGRKRSGSGYDNNPEPSSPKVTCIGQVRVKTRKHVKKKMRARSRRKGETSFRRSSEQNDGAGGCRFDASENRWVHFPVTICESLRAFGSDFNCFSSCRSSCTDDGHRRDRDGRRPMNDGCGGGSSCGAVFTRWFVAVEETGGKRREIELVVGGEDEVEHNERRRSRRRHVFEGLDFSELDVKTEKKEKGEDAGRIGICAPPTNALLLMRCRSDPVKVAALASRVRETQMSLNDGAEAEEDDNGAAVDEVDERRRIELEMEDKKRIEICEKWISGKMIPEIEIVEEAESTLVSRGEEEAKVMEDSVDEGQESKALEDSCEDEMEATFMRNIEDDIMNALEEDEQPPVNTDLTAAAEGKKEEREEEDKDIVASGTQNEERSESEDPDNPDRPELDPNPAPQKRGNPPEATEKETTPYKVLPDCLLLMMCEPKLSMEVSKETWVCSTDFVRGLPERPPVKKSNGGGGRDEPKKRTAPAAESLTSSRRRSTDKPVVNPVLLQPPRSSCSYPAAPPAIVSAVKATAEEHKFAGASNKAYEPPVLPRCKSEPRRSASKLAPEACFWKNRKLEPHPPATVGVGAAGVGF
ncbi:PREDICTED: uncharacterized protein LOC104810455 isoform X2 [Tarenaya hassleriana]|uniref:uncharacterized protein LOC104810455 isoform X2 n=1 Tax=Tarenaya hassleriana TaxID=28532 RepID=UPI00053C7C5D|nr:PREDICTED: uncharacterized protein LOC104810455 isoform X2 [Tarenaya hassleriana]